MADAAKKPIPGAELAKSTATVAIGCKLPNGYIMELVEPAPHGNHPLPAGHRVILQGANSTLIDVSKAPTHHRYAVTIVDKSFADAWFERNKGLAPVKKGLIFCVDNERAFLSEARDRDEDSATKTGMEPLNPDKDARNPRDPVTKEIAITKDPDLKYTKDPRPVAA